MTGFLRHLAAIAIAASSCLSIAAHATVVDFSGQPLGNNPNPLELSGATFTTVGGFNFVTGSGSLCPSVSNNDSANCSRTLEVGFAGGASDVSFGFRSNNNRVVGDDIGDVEIYSGNNLLGTLDMVVADDISATLDPVSLAGYGNVTRIVISSTDFGGLIYDDFRFDLANGVPEPATGALALAAAGLGALARRRRGSSPSIVSPAPQSTNPKPTQSSVLG